MRSFPDGGRVMKQLFGMLVMGLVVGVVGFGGCGVDSDSPTGPSNEVTKGPDGQTLEIKTEEWDNGNIKVEFQYYRNGGSVIKHGWLKEYDETGNIIDEDIYNEGLCVENCEWRKFFGDGEGNSVQQTVDGGFVVTGRDGYDLFLLKTNELGNI